MTLGGFFKTFLLLKRRKKRAAALGISEHRGSLLPEKQNENVFIALHVSLVSEWLQGLSQAWHW